MHRYLSVIILAALYTACSAMQSLAMQSSAVPPTPDQKVLRSLQTIVVIPLAGRAPIYSFTSYPSITRGEGLMLLPLFAIVGGIAKQADDQAKEAAIPEAALTIEREPQRDIGSLTGALATAAAEALQQQGGRTVSLVDGYLRVPVAETAKSLADVRFEAQTRLRRWYNEDVARVDYSGMTTEGIDAILEVGVPGYQYHFACVGGYAGGCALVDPAADVLILQVQVRLVNPATKAVLGRATHQVNHPVTYREVVPRGFLGGKWLPPVPGQQLDNLVKDTGREALLECLKGLGLLAP